MNKKKNPDLVRNIHFLVRMNKPENNLFKNQLESANGMKSTDFIREMITKGYVQAPIRKSDRVEARELLNLLLEYRTDFKRIGSLIRDKDSLLTKQVEITVKAIQEIINRV